MNLPVMLDLAHREIPDVQSVVVRQGESGALTLKIAIVENKKPVDLTGYEAYLKAARPDGAVISQPCTIEQPTKGCVSYTLPPEIAGVVGKISLAHVEIRKGDTLIATTDDLSILVRPCVDMDAAEAESVVSEIDHLKDLLHGVIDDGSAQLASQSSEFATFKSDSQAATTAANTAASNADESASSALSAAQTANTAASNADESASGANASKAAADAATAAANAAAADAIAAAEEARGAVPIFDAETGVYTNASLAAWLAKMRDGKIYGVSVPKGSATACTKTASNAGIANPLPGIIGRAAIDPYVGRGAFAYFEVNGGVDADGMPYVTAIDGDGRFSRTDADVWVMTPVLYTLQSESDNAVQMTVSDTKAPGLSLQPGSLLPNGSMRPYMLYAKYALSVDADGNPRSVSGVKVKNRTVSHDAGVTLCKTSTTGYSLKTAADDWYVKVMFLLKYATKNSQSVFAGCTSYDVSVAPSVAETGTTRVIVPTSTANNLLVGSSMMLGTNNPTTADRGNSKAYDVFDGLKIIRKESYDASNAAIYFESATTFDTDTTYKLFTGPWSTGSCDLVEGDGSPTSPTSGKEPYAIQGIEVALGLYEVLGNVLLNSTGSGWSAYVNHDTRTERAGSMPDGTPSAGTFPGAAGEGWQYGMYPATVHGLMMQQGTGASTSTGICDGNYKAADTVVGWREWSSLGSLGDGGDAGLCLVIGYRGTSSAWWYFGSRLSVLGRSRG